MRRRERKNSISSFQRLLSYFWSIKLKEGQSTISKNLQVFLSKGRLRLESENAIYSYDDLYTSFGNTFRQLELGKLDIRRALVLGYGLGSVHLLAQEYHKDIEVVGVEKDEMILDWVKELHPGLTEKAELISEDAGAFMNEHKSVYDLICVDLYIDDRVPRVFTEKEFLNQLKCNLSDAGLLIFSTLNFEKGTDFAKVELRFKEVFPDIKILQVGQNRMFYNSNS